MIKYILFTKSFWSEAPRLRHQVANLLKSFGGEVVFFEKPGQWGGKDSFRPVSGVEPGLSSVRTSELLHHQLRVFPFLRSMNARFEIREIRKALSRVDCRDAVIFNFNYDYYFLRDLFPYNKIVTIINDDFIAQAKFFDGKYIADALSRTCAVSDAVLVVSYPLAEQVKKWCDPQLFFPWADIPYSMPSLKGGRKGVLVWAHINRSIDFELLRNASQLRPDIFFHIVGPVAENAQPELDALKASGAGFEIKGSSRLDELVLENYFCSVIPYKVGVKYVEAVTMSNKTLQLLARGIPIVTHGMPNFYRHDAIVNANTVDAFVAGLDFCRDRFEELQPSIEKLVSENQAVNRFEQLQRILKG